MHWPYSGTTIRYITLNVFMGLYAYQKMEDIGDFVVLRQLVTSFCPQVVKYIVHTLILHVSHYFITTCY